MVNDKQHMKGGILVFLKGYFHLKKIRDKNLLKQTGILARKTCRYGRLLS